jgi:hypothetical protein
MLTTCSDYAKLQRKRDKMAGPDGEAPPIDLETLRASARAAEASKEGSRGNKGSRSQQTNGQLSPVESEKQSSHTGSFQLIPVTPSGVQESASVTLTEPHRIPPPSQVTQMSQQNGVPGSVPPPPWPTTAMGSLPPTSSSINRGYSTAAPEPLSFLRTPHSITADTSTR